MNYTAWDWIGSLVPYFVGTGLVFWVYMVQERVELLERRIEELEELHGE